MNVIQKSIFVFSFIENRFIFLHVIYSDYAFCFLYSFQFILSSPPIRIPFHLSLEDKQASQR